MPRMSLRLILMASTALVSPAFAEEAGVYELEEIRIEGQEAQELLGNAQVTEEEIAARNPSTMQDVFNGESAITSSGGAAIAQKVYVNGIEESLLSVTIDAARQNKSAFHHAGNVLIDPSLLKAVEVSSGLAPADSGPGAMAGSIAYTTKDARDLLEPGDNFGGFTTLSAGTNGQGVRSTLTFYGQEGGFEYLLNGSRHSGSQYEDGTGTTVPGTEPDLTSFMAKLAYTSDEGHHLSFSASHTEDTGLRAAQYNGYYGVFFTRPDFFTTNDRTTGLPVTPVLMEALSQRKSYNLTYTNEAPQGWFAPTLQIAYNEQTMDVVGVWGVNKSLSAVFSNEFQLGNGTLNAGIDYFNDSAEGYSRSAINLGYLGQEKIRGVGVFAQARQDLNERISVSYGARFDSQNFTGADGSQFSDSGASVNASFDYMLSDTLSLNAGLASSWGGYELGEAALINLSAPWVYSGMQTSRATSGRIGLRYASGGWDVRGALFRTEAKDLSAVLPSFPTNNRAATTTLDTRGFDGSVGYAWHNGFARVNYTYADVTENGAPIGGTRYYYGRPMGHIFGLEAGWQATDKLRVGGTAQIALENDDVATGEAPLDAYEVVNLFAEYRPETYKNLTIRFDVQNLFDTTYVARGADTTASAVDLTEPGRTFAVTATFEF
ncbi:TonB-dependent receptor [Shimia sp. CNT1-13L.2]|uniref:TonB-dependent receptor domain-containing protein n=1 Tax=Shimia sp. CNT1-13L.2 TaxID=2959663 RepID=UPI0020CD21F6|nr:TonB-dependent receptor [Shimia sp. CNT1-13L.2]MCP9484094.1 TonB-dependent receptor [Shimia sp. CNT1-13L.2]